MFDDSKNFCGLTVFKHYAMQLEKKFFVFFLKSNWRILGFLFFPETHFFVDMSWPCIQKKV